MPVIVNKSRVLRTVSGKTFEPGANELSSADWQRISAGDYAQALIARGVLVSREPSVPEAAQTSAAPINRRPDDLDALKPGAATKLVSETTDPELLAKWLEVEARSYVRKAIVKQRYTVAADEAEASGAPEPSDKDTEPKIL